MRIAIVDYGLANIRSVVNAIECLGQSPYVATSGADLEVADKIILPGVGSFDAGMKGLCERGHVEALNFFVLEKKIPCLGICLGFQFFFEGSEEGREPGLGWFKGRAREFDKKKVKVPHVGWNELVVKNDSRLFREISSPVDVYFVHSFYVPHDSGSELYGIGYCEYGLQYIAAVEREQIFGVQFHPEKSQLVGIKILENFLNDSVIPSAL